MTSPTPRQRRSPRRATGTAAPGTQQRAAANGPITRRRATLGAGLTRAVYVDDDGRRWAVLVPPGREADAALGIVVGPPDLGAMGLPAAVALRLHNELHARGILTLQDARGRPQELYAALQAAYRMDAAALLGLYAAAVVQQADQEDEVQL